MYIYNGYTTYTSKYNKYFIPIHIPKLWMHRGGNISTKVTRVLLYTVNCYNEPQWFKV